MLRAFGGVVASGAMAEVQELAELLDVPVAITFMGKGTLPDTHPLCLEATSPVHPLQVIRAFRATMATDDVLICDSGFNQIWGGQYFEVERAGRTYMGPRGSGVMGLRCQRPFRRRWRGRIAGR